MNWLDKNGKIEMNYLLFKNEDFAESLFISATIFDVLLWEWDVLLIKWTLKNLFINIIINNKENGFLN